MKYLIFKGSKRFNCLIYKKYTSSNEIFKSHNWTRGTKSSILIASKLQFLGWKIFCGVQLSYPPRPSTLGVN